MSLLTESLLKWADRYGRHDLPWQKNPSPYAVWISEVMLQQTQVRTVIPYFNRFMKRFPSVASLAAASINEVLHLWSGLGYYARAKRLHETAQQLVKKHHSQLPCHYDQLMLLPGIGRSTAGAILSFAYKKPYPILDGNVKRILHRYYKLERSSSPSQQTSLLWKLVHDHLPKDAAGPYNQAWMDLGTLVCRPQNPQCHICPLRTNCAMAGPTEAILYPQSLKSKPRPLYEKIFLVIYLINDPQAIWLQPRVATDQIWKGLYAFPEFDSVESASAWLFKTTNLKLPSEPFKVERHRFTHLDWRIRYYQIQLQARTILQRHTLVSSGIWYTASSQSTIGLPSPVQRVIAAILNEHCSCSPPPSNLP